MTGTAKLALALAAFALAACEGEEEVAGPERVRAIKTFTVAQPAGGQVRNFSGSLSAAETSALSFSVSGTTAEIRVAQGDSVSTGDVIATLDQEPFLLDVEEARSSVASARAQYDEKRANIDRQRQLYEKGWLAKAGLDSAVAAFEVAEGELNVARSRLASAERDLAQTRLEAPFDGLIASRDVEPFQEVAAGQALFQINASGTMEVDISVPDNIVTRIAPGAPVSIDVANHPDCGCEGRVAEIGVASNAANAVTVTAVLSEAKPGILPGMSAEVALTLASAAEEGGFLVPITAIAPGDDGARGYVFVFDASAGVVRKRPVVGGAGVFQNLVAVREGVAAGDIVASAGVSFLRDGQAVKLLGQ